MFIPLHDGKPVAHIGLQWVTLAIIAINIAVWAIISVVDAGGGVARAATISFGYIPSVINDIRALPVEYDVLPDSTYFLTAITYAFLHADFWHLAGNMLFLWVFADNVEDAMGHLRFILFFLLCCIAAAFVHGLMDPASDAPLIGASGGAAGVIGAYLMLHPKMRVWILAFGRIPLRIPALWVLGAWIAFQVVMLFYDPLGETSWAAHVGGFAAGVVLVLILRRRGVQLFDRELVPVEPSKVPLEEPKRWGRR